MSNIIWLKEGLEGDDTDGHVDDIARFVNENTVVCMSEANNADKNYEALQNNLQILKNSKTESGQKLNVIELPMPDFVGDKEGRLPASYANFYIGNSCILLPVFGHANDKKAISILEKSFPNRKVIPIRCNELVYGFGAIHCVTQQQPEV